MNTEDHIAALPKTVSLNMAAAIAARPRRVIQRWIDTGLLPVELVGKRRQAVRLADLAERMEKPITPAMYLAADRKLDRLRATTKRYNDQRHVRDSGAGIAVQHLTECPDVSAA